MKKITALFLVAALVLSLAACSATKDEPELFPPEETPEETSCMIDEAPTDDEPTRCPVGSWMLAASPVVTDEQKALLEKATAELVGAQYTPVAYVASQIVSGTNHLLLCRVKPIVPEPHAIEKYALVYLYKDLQGNVTLDKVVDSGAWTYLSDEALPGGWYEPSPVLEGEALAAFEKATENYIAAVLTPIALVSEQVVAGKNYRVFCKVTPNLEAIDYEYAIVNVSADLNGNATFGLIEPFMENWQEVTEATVTEQVGEPIGDPIAPAQG